ncbi:Unknown protein, partial [Striga hermonthica]
KPSNMHALFVLQKNEVEALRNSLSACYLALAHLPSFTVTNCMEFAVVEIKHGKLRCEDVFFTAGKLIGELISNKVNKKELLTDADEWLVKCWPLIGKRTFRVSGSLRFGLGKREVRGGVN